MKDFLFRNEEFDKLSTNDFFFVLVQTRMTLNCFAVTGVSNRDEPVAVIVRRLNDFFPVGKILLTGLALNLRCWPMEETAKQYDKWKLEEKR